MPDARKMSSVALTAALLFAVGACASSSQIRLAGSPDIPAAQGNVTVGTTENGNTSVQFTVKHLAPPDKVSPGSTVYLVWARPLDPGSTATSLGALQLSENLEGELATVTPLRAFDIFLTPESAQAATFPSGREMLTARVQMRNK